MSLLSPDDVEPSDPGGGALLSPALSPEPDPSPGPDPFAGPCDEAAIRDYLAERDVAGLVQTAAQMRPGLLTGTGTGAGAAAAATGPRALVAAARELRLAAEMLVYEERVAQAAAMNFTTLLILAQRLELECPTDPLRPQVEDLSDPLKGPVLRRLHALVMESSRQAWERERQRMERTLALADVRSARLRPELPCGLETALRYALGREERTPWKLLKEGFLDFLATYQTGIARESVPQRVQEVYARHWSAADCVRDLRSLAWLAGDFREFWEEHGGKYRSRHYEEGAEKGQRRGVFRQRGWIGVELRESHRWGERTARLVACLEADPVRAREEETGALVEAFLCGEPEAARARTRRKLAAFAGALIHAARHSLTQGELIKILRSEGIVGLAEAAAEECAQRVRAALALALEDGGE